MEGFHSTFKTEIYDKFYISGILDWRLKPEILSNGSIVKLLQVRNETLKWGTVCKDGFTDVTATVICKSFGFAIFRSWGYVQQLNNQMK